MIKGDYMELLDFGGFILNAVNFLHKLTEKHFGAFKINATNADCVLGKTPIPDGEGGYYNGSRVEFRLEIINRKDKKIVLSDIHCKAMCQRELLRDKICCYNKNGYNKVAAVRVYEPITAIDIEPKSSSSYDIKLSLDGDLSQCDKLVFYYKQSIKFKRIIVWEK